ncbi:MAG: DEAD/DEAH box helicase [Bacteroidota bacterium]|nr:DEAD/DEAH box helicase [Bacteroidota bacterium]
MAFKALGLADQLVQGILATGYTAPTEIQARAIPHAIAGKDIIGCANTGTGKTAAFVLPILNKLALSEARTHHVKALILTPTRELTQQIEDAIAQYGRFMQLRTVALYGGTNIQNQLKKLHRGIDIVIATPGRILDHLARRSVDLSKLEVLVLDEADRMFDMGFINDVRKIIAYTPSTRQTLLFSATMSKEVRALVKNIQKNPELIEIGERRSPAKTVTQNFYSVHQEKKADLLLHILQTQKLDVVLVFSRTKHGADKVAHKLERQGIKSIAIHSNRTQAQRERALAGFKQGRYNVLVATDVAARGIDVEGISHVINYDIPTFAEDYIHRIGRTGRAEHTGDAITFVSRDEVKHLKKIEHFTGRKFELKQHPTFDYSKVVEKTAHHEERPREQGHRPHREERFDAHKRREFHPRTGEGDKRKPPFDRNDRFSRFRKDKRNTPTVSYGQPSNTAQEFKHGKDTRVHQGHSKPHEGFDRYRRIEKENMNHGFAPKKNSDDWRMVMAQNEEAAGKKKKKKKKLIHSV